MAVEWGGGAGEESSFALAGCTTIDVDEFSIVWANGTFGWTSISTISAHIVAFNAFAGDEFKTGLASQALINVWSGAGNAWGIAFLAGKRFGDFWVETSQADTLSAVVGNVGKVGICNTALAVFR